MEGLIANMIRKQAKIAVQKSFLPVAGIGDIAGRLIDSHRDPIYDHQKIIPVGSRGYEPYAALTRGLGNWTAFKRGGRVGKTKSKPKRKKKS